MKSCGLLLVGAFSFDSGLSGANVSGDRWVILRRSRHSTCLVASEEFMDDVAVKGCWNR